MDERRKGLLVNVAVYAEYMSQTSRLLILPKKR